MRLISRTLAAAPSALATATAAHGPRRARHAADALARDRCRRAFLVVAVLATLAIWLSRGE